MSRRQWQVLTGVLVVVWVGLVLVAVFVFQKPGLAFIGTCCAAPGVISAYRGRNKPDGQ